MLMYFANIIIISIISTIEKSVLLNIFAIPLKSKKAAYIRTVENQKGKID